MGKGKKCVGLEGVWRGRGGEDERVGEVRVGERVVMGGGSMLGWGCGREGERRRGRGCEKVGKFFGKKVGKNLEVRKKGVRFGKGLGVKGEEERKESCLKEFG